MMKYYLLDDNGFYLGVQSDAPFEGINQTNVPITGNFVKFKFDGENWVEGATVEEIAEYRKQFVPLEVPLWALRTVLKSQSLFQHILDAINGLPEPPRTAALDYLEYGNFVERNSNTVLMIQQITSMTESDVDELFIAASNLKL